MQVFKLYFKQVWFHKMAIIPYIIIFMIISVYSSLYYQSQKIGEYTLSKPNIQIFDYDQSAKSEGLINYLADKTTLQHIIADNVYEISEAIHQRRLDQVIIIPKAFQNNDLIIYQQNNLNSTNFRIDNDIKTYLIMYDQYQQVAKKPANISWLNQKLAHIDDKVYPLENNIRKQQENDYHKALTSILSFSDYPMIAMALVVVGYNLVTMESLTTKNRELVSGYSELKRYIFIFIASYFTMTIIWLILIFGTLVLAKVPIAFNQAIRWQLFASYLHCLCVTSLALMLGQFFRNKKALNFLSTILSLLCGFSSGIFVPRNLLPEITVAFGRIFPAYYNQSIQEYIYSNFTSSFDINTIYPDLTIMALMTLAFFLLTLVAKQSQNKQFIHVK